MRMCKIVKSKKSWWFYEFFKGIFVHYFLAKLVLIIMGVLSSTDLDAFVKAMQEQQKKKDDKGEKKEETMDTDWK